MRKPVADQLEKLCDEGEKSTSNRECELWSKKARAFLTSAVGPDEADEFLRLTDDDDWIQHALRLGHLQGLIARAKAETEAETKIKVPLEEPAAPPGAGPAPPSGSRKVFVVHGHDNEAKQSTARFLERLGLQPIILHEQPSSGRTIIEKFEMYSGEIDFAVVLLTPDDVGGLAIAPEKLHGRARQNVIMELGYFMGRLGRVRVCALYKTGVELPSDYQGVLYIEMDSASAWKAKLAQEFVQAKLPIDLSALLSG
jgi:predicted nucleotide-binding protein